LFENVEQIDRQRLAKESEGYAVEFDILPTWRPVWHCSLMYTVCTADAVAALKELAALCRLHPRWVLGGKVLGIFLLLHSGDLIPRARSFGVKWGDATGLIVLILAIVFGGGGAC
jgi:hypothetical protein